MFGDDAFVLHRQQISGKRHDPAAGLHVGIVKRCFQIHFYFSFLEKRQEKLLSLYFYLKDSPFGIASLVHHYALQSLSETGPFT